MIAIVFQTEGNGLYEPQQSLGEVKGSKERLTRHHFGVYNIAEPYYLFRWTCPVIDALDASSPLATEGLGDLETLILQQSKKARSVTVGHGK